MNSPDLRATYRLQLSASFGFADALLLVPYLRELGVSHLYLSPSLQAHTGSTHGYDVVDPGRVAEVLGGEAGLRSLAAASHEAGLGLVLDVVPNHMAACAENRYWADPALRERFFDLDPVTGHHRRFFDIDDMAGVRQEDAFVFEKTHALVLELVRDGVIDGLRVDHPDGLADPRAYLGRLREGGVQRVWVEKILDPGERLRDWPVCGTVGYEFLNDVCALFVDPAAEQPFTALWGRVSDDHRGFGEVAYESKLEQLRGTFVPEVERLERLAAELGGGQETLAKALASLPVYRTYVEPAAGLVAEEDRQAVAAAGMPPRLAQMLLLERPAPPEFVIRFQQTTPAVMAKGVEDTAFYRYGRLLALNDVGGDPSRFGIPVQRFHAANIERDERFPFSLVTTQTHDTKRSADVRAAIAALSWAPEAWEDAVERWFAATESLCSEGAPDPVERYFLFQTLAGAWPISGSRLSEYMVKALREAKRNTNWTASNGDWESAVERFCAALYSCQSFLADFEPFVRDLRVRAEVAVLGQVALKLTVPGVADIYQGDELPYRALVDPDNRRPVDWERRRRALKRSDPACAKLWVTSRLLALRCRRSQAFSGGYEPLDAGDEACAFVRGGDVVVAVALRERPAGRAIALPRGRWRNVLTGSERSGGRMRTSDLLDPAGIAVLERVGVGSRAARSRIERT